MRTTIAMRAFWAAPVAVLGLCATVHAGDLSVVGTGDGIDLLRALGAAYTADHPETNVIVPPSVGSGGGIAAVGSDKEVLARVARPLSDSEKEAGLVATPVFRLPSAFFVHRAAGVSRPHQCAARRHLSRQDHQLARRRRRRHAHQGGAARGPGLDAARCCASRCRAGRISAITEKSKTAVTTQDCIDTVKEVPGAIGFGPFTRALEMELAVLKIDGRHPTDRDYPSAVTLSFVHKDSDRHARRQAFHRLREGRARRRTVLTQHGRRSGRRVRTGTARGRGLAPPFFAQYPADHRCRCDRDGRVRGLVRPDHRPARSGPRAAGRAARAGCRRRSSASGSTARRGLPARVSRQLFASIARAARKHRAARRRREGDLVRQRGRDQRAARPRRAGRRHRRHPGGRHQAAGVRRRERQGRHRGGEPGAAGQLRSPRRSWRYSATTTASARASCAGRSALTDELAQALGAPATAPLAFVVAEPIFDDFGDVFAGADRAPHAAPARAGAGGVLPARGRGRAGARGRGLDLGRRASQDAAVEHRGDRRTRRCCAPGTAASGRAATRCSSSGASARSRRSASCTPCATS